MRALNLFALLILAVANPLLADEPAEIDFARDVRPLMKQHCFRCHGEEDPQAGVRLDILSLDLVKNRAAAQTWQEVLNVLNSGEMPPKDEPRLPPAKRAVMTRWVTQAIQTAIAKQKSTGGRVVMRRLNRQEYQNTMFDLLGLDMNYVRDLPPEGLSPEGFQNNGQSLRMSALQLEYYLETARRALDRVIVSGPMPERFNYIFTKSNVRGWLGPTEMSNRLGRGQKFLAKMKDKYPEVGEFRIVVRARAELVTGKGFPRMEVSLGYRPDTFVLFRVIKDVEVSDPQISTYEFRGRLENYPLPVRGQGKFPGLVVRVRNIYEDGTPAPGYDKKSKRFPEEKHMPHVVIENVQFLGPVFESWPPLLHQRILFPSNLRQTNEKAYVRQVLKRFMSWAFRRPVRTDEVERFARFYQKIRPDFPNFEETMRETLAMVLIQPDFLYLLERDSQDRRPIDAFEMASRLSYMLWSTMPDNKLIQSARSGKLLQESELKLQTERLMSDPRFSRFSEQFATHWLKLDVANNVAVSKEYYPKFQESLKQDMKRETIEFFREIVDKDLGAIQLLDSDFAMLNERLARHYGIPNVYGNAFRRVPLKAEYHRGGLLTHAGLLLANSTGKDSHVIRRAVWIRDRLLHDPPAPPPPNVPTLDEIDKDFARKSIREQLEIHRNTTACASCHRNLDGWGLALENYDAVGLWRDKIRHKVGKKFEERPVVSDATLGDGTKLLHAQDLKQHLLGKKKREFARSIVVHMLSYSLGRSLELSDRDLIEQLTDRFLSNDLRIRALISDIVLSTAFQTK